MSKTAQDEQIQKFIQVIVEKKQAIAKAEAKPSWRTNCSFKWSEDVSLSMNIQTVSDIDKLVSAASYLLEKAKSYVEAKKLLEVEGVGEFKHCGFTLDEWITDFKTRIAKIQVTAKKKELEVLEERLNKLISPELKAKLELEEISKLLA